MRNKLRRCALAFSLLSLLGSTVSWAQTQTVQVLTWNVHQPGSQAAAEQQVDFIASLNPRPDIIVLQEAMSSWRTAVKSRLNADTLLTWNDEFALHCRTGAGADGSCTTLSTNEGVQVLSRFPKVSSATHLFVAPDSFWAGRAAARMTLNVNGTILTAFSFHFPTNATSRQQMVPAVKAWAAETSSPRLLGGDFNAAPTAAEIAPPNGMTGTTGGAYTDAWAVVGVGSGFTSPNRTNRIDYWFSDAGGPATPTAASNPSTGLSDHLPVLVTYRIGASTTSPTVVPGVVQAEDFDSGGEGTGYHDLTANNQGGAYRLNEGVDIQATTDVGGGFNVGWIRASEWMKYTINVTTTTTYNLLFRVAAPSLGGNFHFEIDGNNVTGSMPIPATGDWQTWQTITKPGVAISAGVHTVRFLAETESATLGATGNLNYFEIRPASETILLADDFNDNSFNTSLWVKSMFSGLTDPNMAVTEVGGRLEIGPLADNLTGSHYNGARSVGTFDFRGASVHVELAQAASQAGPVFAMLTIGDADNHYRFFEAQGNLVAQRKIAGGKKDVRSVAYAPATHAFLRIRHAPSPTGDRVVFETAPKIGSSPGTWSPFFEEAWNNAVPAAGLQFELKGGTSDPVPAPGKVIFDNFKASRPN